MTLRTEGADADPFENDGLRPMPGDAGADDASQTAGDAADEFDVEEEPEEEADLDGGDADADPDEGADADPQPDAEPTMSAAQIENLKSSINVAYMNVETRKMIAERDLEPLKAAKETYEGNLEKLKAIKRQARADKDRDRVDQADDLIEQTLDNIAAVAKKLEPLEKTVGEYDGKLKDLKTRWDELHAEPKASGDPAQQTDWTKRNAWFRRDGTDAKSVYARDVAKKLYEDGYTADKPALWRELDRQMKIKFPDMRTAAAGAPAKKAANPARPVKPGGTASSVVAAGTGSRAGAGKGKLTVPKGLKETWLKKGWDLKDLAKYAVRD